MIKRNLFNDLLEKEGKARKKNSKTDVVLDLWKEFILKFVIVLAGEASFQVLYWDASATLAHVVAAAEVNGSSLLAALHKLVSIQVDALSASVRFLNLDVVADINSVVDFLNRLMIVALQEEAKWSFGVQFDAWMTSGNRSEGVNKKRRRVLSFNLLSWDVLRASEVAEPVGRVFLVQDESLAIEQEEISAFDRRLELNLVENVDGG